MVCAYHSAKEKLSSLASRVGSKYPERVLFKDGKKQWQWRITQVLADLLKRQSHSRHCYSIASKIWRSEGGGKCKPLIMHSPWMVSFYSNSRKEVDNWTERCMGRNKPFKTACNRWLKVRTVLLKRFYSCKQFKYLHTFLFLIFQNL